MIWRCCKSLAAHRGGACRAAPRAARRAPGAARAGRRLPALRRRRGHPAAALGEQGGPGVWDSTQKMSLVLQKKYVMRRWLRSCVASCISPTRVRLRVHTGWTQREPRAILEAAGSTQPPSNPRMSAAPRALAVADPGKRPADDTLERAATAFDFLRKDFKDGCVTHHTHLDRTAPSAVGGALTTGAPPPTPGAPPPKAAVAAGAPAPSRWCSKPSTGRTAHSWAPRWHQRKPRPRPARRAVSLSRVLLIVGTGT